MLLVDVNYVCMPLVCVKWTVCRWLFLVFGNLVWSSGFLLLWVPLHNMWPTEWKPSTSRKCWIRGRGIFIRTGRFQAKPRLLHQGVTRGLHSIILNYEARLSYYIEAKTHRQVSEIQWETFEEENLSDPRKFCPRKSPVFSLESFPLYGMGMRCYEQLSMHFKNDNFTSFQSVYGCLSA